MARQPQLRKKKIGKFVYWFTKSGGKTYFGNVQEVSYQEARKAFREHIGNLKDAESDRKSKGFSAGDLMDAYLDWLQVNRSVSNYKNRRAHLNRFGKFCPAGKDARIADLPATKITGNDLEEWLRYLADDLKLGPQTRLHYETSVRAAIRMIETVYGHFRNEHLQEAQARLDQARHKR